MGLQDIFEIDGIGFVPSKEDPFCFLDLDRIANAETREVQAWVVRLLEELDSFAYLTPSDNGLRIVIRGILTEGGGRYIYRDKEGDHVLEVYASNQFLTFTHQIWDKPIREAQKWLNNLKKISVFSPRNRLRYEFPEVTLYGDLEDIREEVRMKPYLEICGRMRVKERLCLGY